MNRAVTNKINLSIIGNVLLILLLASCSSRHVPAPVVDVKPHTPLKKRIKQSIKATEYIVKKGETLYSISWRADLDIRTIAKLNNIHSPYQIYPGQKIKLFSKSVQPSKRKPSNKIRQSKKEIVVKKPVAPNKKQEYGGNVSGNNIDFNQKIRKWYWPVKGKVITKYSATKQGNKGINIAGKRGDSVKSAAGGKVVYAGDALRGYGKLVIVKHNDDYLSAYAHNDHILVKEQQIVKAGEKIAKMGDTGAERVMLHFEVRFRGKSVNPMKYLSKK
jgi:lipoprotein NlpD